MRKLLTVLMLAMVPQISHAGLGDREDQIDHDVIALKGLRQPRTFVHGLNVHHMTTGNADVHMYTDAGGNVFAVSWTGVHHPDLSVLLSSYHHEFVTGRARPVEGSRISTFTGQDLVVQLYGRPHRMRGVAYIPSRVPASFTLGDIK